IECRAPKPGASEAKKPNEEEEYGDVEPPPCEVKAGINRVWWDLRSERTTQIRLRTTPLYASDVPFGPEGWRKPPAMARLMVLAAPGTYTVTLTLGEAKFAQQLTAVQEELQQRRDKAAQDFQQLVGKDLAAFNAMLREHSISNIYLKTP